MGILIFVRSTLQFVQHIKRIRQLLCTFSSCSDFGINMIYNIYISFMKNKGPNKHHFFTSLTQSLTSHTYSLTHFHN